MIAALLSCMGCAVYAQDKAPVIASPDSHAPIGVMGDHVHGKGELMFSYRFMSMRMGESLIGKDEVAPETIVTTIPNLFSGMTGMPPTLRVVPVSMTMNMHMVGVMYAPSDAVTLMLMGMYVQKDMDHTTFQGGMGVNELGVFTTSTSGLGDTRITALVKLLKKDGKSLHLNAGLSLPTGSITETDDILTPMNMNPTVRLPYPMQLGSGSLDALPGLTFSSKSEKIGWGSQVSTVIRLTENDEDYQFGNEFTLTSWGSYKLSKWLSGSLRATYFSAGEISGTDDNIAAPVQTANPAFQGGQRVDIGAGLNAIGQSGFIANHRLAIEFSVPAYQDLNGPQMKTNSVLTIGWQYAL